MTNNDNIFYQIEEIDNKSEFNIEELIHEISNNEHEPDCEMIIPQMINYNINYTVKELLIICEYYGFAREVKSNRLNKDQIIQYIIAFENDITNADIVFQRKNFWFYMNELKNDKFMKKYVLW
jgi:hypothetical protein